MPSLVVVEAFLFPGSGVCRARSGGDSLFCAAFHLHPLLPVVVEGVYRRGPVRQPCIGRLRQGLLARSRAPPPASTPNQHVHLDLHKSPSPLFAFDFRFIPLSLQAIPALPLFLDVIIVSRLPCTRLCVGGGSEWVKTLPVHAGRQRRRSGCHVTKM
ncbi:hypothetical protein BRADI_1g68025v3 [Brachypodium distachyon]|uniref:Uncharacterized protein n=1 Tax=Brachypodium distachyon TaxID=15368 RepID=A0A0Q3HI15_BRADI|nr:hypothetical protein BRADI_1g68025v3 [Brachypodium distachyon]